MKLFSVLLVSILGLWGSAVSAVTTMRTPGDEVPSIQQKPQHEAKKPPVGKTQSSQQKNYQTVPLTVPVKQNR